MTWINGLLVTSGAVVVDASTPSAGDPRIDGRSYDPATQALHAFLTGLATTDTTLGGLRLATDGSLRVVDASLGVPATARFVGGLAVSPSGQLYVHEGGTVTQYINGWPVTATGALVVSGLSAVVNTRVTAAADTRTTKTADVRITT